MRYEEIITAEWLDGVFETGLWDVDHGSDLARLVEDIQAGTRGVPVCPAGLAACDVDEAFSDPRMRAAVEKWVRARFSNVVSELPKGSRFPLYRVMTVDGGWLDELKSGRATAGLYFSADPGLDGGFWLDEVQPHEVVMHVEASRDDVDWTGTIRARIDYVTGDEEGEVRLLENRTVSLTAIWLDGRRIADVPATLSTGTGRRPSVAASDAFPPVVPYCP